MHSSPHSGRPLPGWGNGLRRTRQTALMLATVAGLALSGCSTAQPTSTASAANTNQIVGVTAGPAQLRQALALAVNHLVVVLPQSNGPFHLIAFQGSGLDASGGTIAANGSSWTFTFSRYADPNLPTQRYEIATVTVPGVGATQLSASVSTDPTLSPINNWDAVATAPAPDSSDLLAHVQALGIDPAGAHLQLSQGVVTITAGGQSVTYDTTAGTYSR